ncbi:hypothetical protein RhiXN_03490 [Rhizoctonia solani]|uniref:Uncharacterized protein n=1 Tax=Rhizoctonia solani TaxID=456999 RepID=A0A8H8SU58_9AGAM|nr:uncharacterized protein RhiXN_03490 [Rhizoctonia solani]QRW18566.1 hypothetical protein RhiXN_03490 [Rhizoctonia solani]
MSAQPNGLCACTQVRDDLHALLESLNNTSRLLENFSETLANGMLLGMGGSDCDNNTLLADGDSGSESKGTLLNVLPAESKIASFPLTHIEKFQETLQIQSTYYVVLEEDFDALPLIALYISNKTKTVCCSAVVESLGLWHAILSNALNQHCIIAPIRGVKVKRLREVISNLLADSRLFAVFLAFKTLALRHIDYSEMDCLLYWGLPQKDYVTEYLANDIRQAPHTCVILTQEEFDRTDTQEKLEIIGAKAHPNLDLFNSFEESSLLSKSRTAIEIELTMHRNESLIQASYLGFTMHYKAGGGQYNHWSPSEVLHQANQFASKVLRRGSYAGTNQRFRPLGPELHLRPKILRSLGFGDQPLAKPSKASHDAAEASKRKGPSQNLDEQHGQANGIISNPLTVSLKHTYLVLEEEFDAIPVIMHLAELHRKVICYISHFTKLPAFANIVSLSHKLP